MNKKQKLVIALILVTVCSITILNFMFKFSTPGFAVQFAILLALQICWLKVKNGKSADSK